MKNIKIMLVDDEERFLATTQKLLAKKGYDAITASSGSRGAGTAGQKQVHVVILDVKMPGMDGIETLKAIKKQFPMVEVIMLTGHATVESAIEGLKSGATDYLMKPAEIDDLIERAEGAYARRQQLEEKIRMIQMRKLMGRHAKSSKRRRRIDSHSQSVVYNKDLSDRLQKTSEDALIKARNPIWKALPQKKRPDTTNTWTGRYSLFPWSCCSSFFSCQPLMG